MDLIPREDRASWSHVFLPDPVGDPPLAPLPSDADPDARTAHAWALARAHAQLLDDTFGKPPAQAAWCFTTREREICRGDDLSTARYEYFAVYEIGLVYDNRSQDASSFAQSVTSGQPLRWPAIREALDDGSGASMRRVRREGAFELDMAADEALPLFTAEGERLWVPGWAPEFPNGDPHQEGQVFLTGAEPARTYWTVVRADAALRRHTFSRTTPGRHAGLVDVQVEPLGQGCRVHVRYDMTALGDDPDALAAYGEEAFAAMLVEWRALIEAWRAR